MAGRSIRLPPAVLSRVASNVVSGVSLVVLVGSAGLLAYTVFHPQAGASESSASGSDTLRFVALLIIFMAALGATAALFVSLRLQNAGEAFGLPSGSIRALLAVGIMILLVVFGLPSISGQADPITPFALPVEAQAAPSALHEAVDAYRAQGLIVVVTNPGSPGASPAANATIRIIGRVPVRSPEQREFAKQLLTAIITLLTTVIGFYFGTRSSTDAIRDAAAPASPAPPTIEDMRRQVADGLTTLETGLKEPGDKLDQHLQANPASVGQGPVNRAVAQRDAIGMQQQQIRTELAAAGIAIAASAVATGEEKEQQDCVARVHLRRALDLLAAARIALGTYALAVNALA